MSLLIIIIRISYLKYMQNCNDQTNKCLYDQFTTNQQYINSGKKTMYYELYLSCPLQQMNSGA